MKRSRLTPYLLSLPERALRSSMALAGGVVRKASEVTLPIALRRTRLYQTMVEATLRFLVEDVGQVKGTYPEEGHLDNFVMRKTAGHGVEVLGLLAFRASPVWVMAALADISGGGRWIIREIGESMKRDGLLEPEGRFESVDQILDGLERSAGHLARTFNAPPVDIAGLRSEWIQLRENLRAIPPRKRPTPEQVDNAWQGLKKEAAVQKVSVFRLSSLMAVSALRIAGTRSARAVLDHYMQTLHEIRRTGYLAYWIREFSPYLKAAGQHFSPKRRSFTQKMFKSG